MNVPLSNIPVTDIGSLIGYIFYVFFAIILPLTFFFSIWFYCMFEEDFLCKMQRHYTDWKLKKKLAD